MATIDLIKDRNVMQSRMEARSAMFRENWVKELQQLPFALLYMIRNLPDELRGNEQLYIDRLHQLPWLSDPEMCEGTIWAALSVAIESPCPKQALAKTVGFPWWSPDDGRYWIGQELRHELTGERNAPILHGDIEDDTVFHEAVTHLRSAAETQMSLEF